MCVVDAVRAVVGVAGDVDLHDALPRHAREPRVRVETVVAAGDVDVV